MLDEAREYYIKDGTAGAGPVIYWMQREMRAIDNWGLAHASARARELGRPLLVVFVLVPSFVGAGERQYRFLLRGLAETAAQLENSGFPMLLLEGEPPELLAKLIKRVGAAALVTDFNPLRSTLGWHSSVSVKIACPFIEVDGHNIVPCRIASPKQEYGAYTLRPKLRRLVARFLTEFPLLGKQSPAPLRSLVSGVGHLLEGGKSAILATLLSRLPSGLASDPSNIETRYLAGTAAGMQRLHAFLSAGLLGYAASGNDPVADQTSHLSVWMHFGQIAPQRVALELARAFPAGGDAVEKFFEQLVVRRELADNFCLYNLHYDSVEGFPNWVREDIEIHRSDPREKLFTLNELEEGRTDDPIWNAAQARLVGEAWLHGYMRMYWAKRILEWTPSVEEAMRVAITLNDRWLLDGRDPNGYTGIAWSLGGLHDRPWQRRDVFGRVRYMNANGCRRKFDVPAWLRDSPRIAPAMLRD
jgi:deoxyribodipyrimidine photo-lyase